MCSALLCCSLRNFKHMKLKVLPEHSYTDYKLLNLINMISACKSEHKYLPKCLLLIFTHSRKTHRSALKLPSYWRYQAKSYVSLHCVKQRNLFASIPNHTLNWIFSWKANVLLRVDQFLVKERALWMLWKGGILHCKFNCLGTIWHHPC